MCLILFLFHSKTYIILFFNYFFHFLESPRFETKFRTQMVKKGEDVSLSCSVTGDPPLSITWTRDKQPLNLETEPR